MAPRPAWKGHLKLSLVTCAVELSNATTHAEKISFRTLNRETGHQVRRQYIDSVTGKPVPDDAQVKGYETGSEEFLIVEEEEIDAVQIESSHTLSLDSFVRKSEIERIYLDTPYYLTPADKVSEEAFAVIRQALEKKKMAGLARIVLYRRERPVVIEPLGKGMLLTTLRYDSTVRRPEAVLDDIPSAKADPEMVDLAIGIIGKKKSPYKPEAYEDRYESGLLELIKAKKAGRRIKPAKAAPRPSNVVNLFDALKKSLASEKDDDAKQEPAPGRAAGKPAGTTSKAGAKPTAKAAKEGKTKTARGKPAARKPAGTRKSA